VFQKLCFPLLVLAVGLSGCQGVASTPTESPVDTAPVEDTAPGTNPGDPDDPPGFDKGLYSLDDPDSVWVIVNKTRPLDPLEYVPEDLVVPQVPGVNQPLLRADAAVALEKMFAVATVDGIDLKIQSSYRSFAAQQRIKASSVARRGQTLSDSSSARAGHSEHQTGLAVDLAGVSGTCVLQECFGTTTEGLWLAENSWKFGFIKRYLEDTTEVTGYRFEPWHYRFVGTELAEEIWRVGNPPLEEFFGLDPAPDYVD
jgi:zinc D-Ala-D-Ala carboxypeptidase